MNCLFLIHCGCRINACCNLLFLFVFPRSKPIGPVRPVLIGFITIQRNRWFEGKLCAITCDSLGWIRPDNLPYTIPAVAIVFYQPIQICHDLFVSLDVDGPSGESGSIWACQLDVPQQRQKECEFRINVWQGKNKVNCQGRNSKWFDPYRTLCEGCRN